MRKRIRYILMLNLMLTFSFLSMAQTTAKGEVVDEEGLSMPGANIQIKGTTKGVVSDNQGKFKIELPKGSETLEVSFMGYKTKEVVAKKKRLVVGMEVRIQTLEEVVVNVTCSISGCYGIEGPSCFRRYIKKDGIGICSTRSNTIKNNETRVELPLYEEKLATVEQPLLIKCYPNPTNGSLNIELPDNTEMLFVTNITGKQLISMHNPNEREVVDLSGYARGTYLVHCVRGNEKMTSKIILMKSNFN